MHVAEAVVVIFDGILDVWFSLVLNINTAVTIATVMHAFACCFYFAIQ